MQLSGTGVCFPRLFKESRGTTFCPVFKLSTMFKREEDVSSDSGEREDIIWRNTRGLHRFSKNIHEIEGTDNRENLVIDEN